jgi:hypothetical protein
MNKKITLAYFSLLVFILFAGCKKNDIIKPNVQNVQLIVLPPFVTDSTTAMRTYKLRGTIVSPGRLDMKDYGFFVKLSTSPFQVQLGSAKKAGYVEKDYISSSPLTESDIVMYAILTSGDTLYSTASTTTTPPTMVTSGFQLTSFTLTPLASTDIYLNSNFTYNPMSGYTVTNYDLLYKLSTAPNFTTISLIPFASGNLVSNLSLMQILGITKGNSYDFQIHVLLSPPSGNTAGPFNYTTTTTSSSF